MQLSSTATTPAPGIPGWAMDDRVLAGLVERGQSREAVCAYLDAPENEVFDRCAALGLPAPANRPLRESRRPNAWQVADIRKLIDAWVRNHHVEYIASALSRSVWGSTARPAASACSAASAPTWSASCRSSPGGEAGAAGTAKA